MKTTTLTGGFFAMLALAATAGCGPDYAVFSVHVSTATGITQGDRDPIDSCKMTIKAQDGQTVLNNVGLEYHLDPTGSYVQSGCTTQLNRTQKEIGVFSYSTSRSSGSLTFTVNALDAGDRNVILTGSGTGEVKKWPPEVFVNIELKKP